MLTSRQFAERYGYPARTVRRHCLLLDLPRHGALYVIDEDAERQLLYAIRTARAGRPREKRNISIDATQQV